MSSNFQYGANAFVNGIRLHYLRFGGKGHPLILIPGITSPAITWNFVAERLGQHFDTYVLDVRGRGLSSSGATHDYSTDACSADIHAFASTLGLASYHLVGHSMGARFAIRSAVMNPQGLQKMVLIDPPVSGPNRRAYPSQLPWYVDSIEQSITGMTAEDMLKYCPTWTLEQRQLRAEWLHTCYLPAIIQTFEEFHSYDIHQFVPQIPVPTLLMVAEKGGVILPEDEKELQQLSSQIDVVKVPNAGHMIPWDNYEGFFQAFSDFLGPQL
ncbi:alpha/beta fold hydrolase [Acinetobacter rathckeae]|uniref:alpha/beta fold hydrolase n=1 Tax=Acinetobacter rathckeae TaxID=2605272 RepID=UPI0018A2E2B0|nr:alpha/beta hydrolase [Acinetobacter rathckeae]MBF7688558.1 alpha/beta hydrolase [Acinetobacter rathckeae]MBF7695805.1 alpha/beta hydrolase [Acinetobacter rathckeae]